MCEYCRQHKCPPMCPNHAAKVIGECAECGEELTVDSEFIIDDDGNNFCDTPCIVDYYGFKVAHMDGDKIVKRKGGLL